MKRLLLAIAILVILTLTGYLLLQEETPEQSLVAESETITADETAQTVAGPVLRKEAETYISEIISGKKAQIDVKTADDFVAGDQSISLSSGQEIEITTPAELIADEGLSPDAPVTLVREQEQIEIKTPAQILAEAGGNLDSKVKILEAGQIRELTVGELLEKYPESSESSVSVVKQVEQFEITTVKEILDDQSTDKNKPIKIIKKPYKLKSTTVDELLMGETDVTEASVYYVKNVSMEDTQGIWGIVHNSLVRNFASGIAIRRHEEIKKYQVAIPVDADERLANHSSSFLGRMISEKTSKSYVYNYENGKMGRNPDLIYPGQEIVIISFTPEELAEIYQHFVARSGL